MSQHKASLLEAKQKSPLVVKSIDTQQPGDGEVLIKVEAAAINPVDWKLQKYGFYLETFPTVLGEDVAGTIVSVGTGVETFKKGDRVLSATPILLLKDIKYGGFQEYVVSLASGTSKIPDTISFAQASTIPLGITTAAHGLYHADGLDLTRPSPEPVLPDHKGEVLLVWGASSSVGLYVVQLASQAGYKVIATASPRNHDLVIQTGAAKVFDHNAADIVDLIKKEAGTDIKLAYDAISLPDTLSKVGEIMQPHGGKVAVTLPDSSALPKNCTPFSVVAFYLFQDKELAGWLFGSYIPKALAEGRLSPNVVDLRRGGLEGLQALYDEMANVGVSGKKLVITL